jgi:alkanesulfonate monooxygenase SsuD/methylene tetrahydromethanopterin reductase-like flavin-dependent oxidoreductase (luciferase family)
MRFGLTLPIFDRLADPGVLADLAVEAEAVGWDGFFLWDHVRYRTPVQAATDPWIALAAVATRTQRLVIGPMVTPLARRRPQIVARQVVALDHLAKGRLVLGVGLGLDASGEEFVRFGEETDLRRRAEMFDEALDLLTALLSGAPVDHHGRHYRAADVQFLPTPARGTVPIWVAGRWPNKGPVRRAARHDGIFVIDLTPDDLPALVTAVTAERGAAADPAYDIVVHDRPRADPAQWAAAGATWLLTTFDAFTTGPGDVRAVITAGPGNSSAGG